MDDMRCLKAGERVRTVDNDVGNVVLYQLSYARNFIDLQSHTVAGIGTSLRPRTNALRCRAFRVQLRRFLTGLSIQCQSMCRDYTKFTPRDNPPELKGMGIFCSFCRFGSAFSILSFYHILSVDVLYIL